MARTALAAPLPDLWTRLTQLIAKPAFQSRAARWPLVGALARRDGAEIFDVVQGFVSSQVLNALVDLNVFDLLASGPVSTEALARATNTDPDRLAVFLKAGIALGFLSETSSGDLILSRKGAALRGVPGLREMILHHQALYRDLEQPANLLHGKTDTHLAAFWPYALDARKVGDEEAERYSSLMAQSQGLVAEDTLRQVSLKGVRHLLDVGGGSGAFLAAVAKRYPAMALTLFDLPETRPASEVFLAQAGADRQVQRVDGSFRSESLPSGADAISLIRVLYDHTDETVSDLLKKVFEALPPNGRLVVSEPMSGGRKSDSITDVYFSVYTMAMGTGKTRSADTIANFLRSAGFVGIKTPRPLRSYVTRTITAVKPG